MITRIASLFFLLVFSLPAASQNNLVKQITQANELLHKRIPMPDGDALSATIVIGKNATGPLPAIVMYGIYAEEDEKEEVKAALAANLGYVGIIVNTRGKKESNSAIAPFKHEAEDAWHILDWISRQPWCDGRIGMYGGSYLGFSQWAATKSMHPALKTIVPQASVGIGIDFPAHNGVYSDYAFQWLKYVSSGKLSEKNGLSKNYSSAGRKLYRSGAAFASLANIDMQELPIFSEWIGHPSYDAYWHKLVPYKEEFAAIGIPVLTITGYYDGDMPGALFYYKQHTKYNPSAAHYLVMGPFDHYGAQGHQGKKVYNYPISPNAQINFNRLVFQWFDHVFKGQPLPELLSGKVNYQIMGTDDWGHASNLEGMYNHTLTFYLSPVQQGNNHTLADKMPTVPGSTSSIVDFKDRASELGNRITGSQVLRKKIDEEASLRFMSAPLEESMTMSGSFFGELIATTNKRDFDLILELYELQPDGTYHDLSHYLARTSYINDREHRQLLTPGIPQKIVFNETFVTAKKMSKGSRLVFLLGVNKNSEWQVNHGTGNDVSSETIADAIEPLRIEWSSSSFIRIPVMRE